MNKSVHDYLFGTDHYHHHERLILSIRHFTKLENSEQFETPLFASLVGEYIDFLLQNGIKMKSWTEEISSKFNEFKKNCQNIDMLKHEKIILDRLVKKLTKVWCNGYTHWEAKEKYETDTYQLYYDKLIKIIDFVMHDLSEHCAKNYIIKTIHVDNFILHPYSSLYEDLDEALEDVPEDDEEKQKEIRNKVVEKFILSTVPNAIEVVKWEAGSGFVETLKYDVKVVQFGDDD